MDDMSESSALATEINKRRQALQSRRADLARRERELQIDEAKLTGLQEALALIGGSAIPTQDVDGTSDIEMDNTIGQRMSPKWRTLLTLLKGAFPHGVGLDQIRIWAAQPEISVADPSLRAQLSNYVKVGFIDRVGPAEYRIGMPGAEVLGASPHELLAMEKFLTQQSD